MEKRQSEVFAKTWIALWNRGELESILAHYAETIVFTSPYASAVTGMSLVSGKDALRAYWSEGLRRATIRHEYRDCLFDEERGRLAIIYFATINGATREACEVMTFDAAGEIRASEAYYGASVNRS